MAWKRRQQRTELQDKTRSLARMVIVRARLLFSRSTGPIGPDQSISDPGNQRSPIGFTSLGVAPTNN
jgi:hypothetical protein